MEQGESMDARFSRTLLFVAVLIISMGARYETPNFIIETKNPDQARQYGDAAERFRRDLAIEWLGEEMPRWGDRCPITVNVGRRLGAGGATTFLFDHGEVFGWRMTIQGSHERVLDSVLPHEITHMILASYFRQPLPRWADEGASTSVEHISERTRHRKMLLEFLQTQRGIPFNAMFAMKEYPSDIMPLYAQGFSLSEYLIQQGGKRRFLAFLKQGLDDERWADAVSHHYGYSNLGMLQNAWLGWVSQGFPEIRRPDSAPPESATPTLLASTPRPRPEPNLIYRSAATPPRPSAAPATPVASTAGNPWRPSGAPSGPASSTATPPAEPPVRAQVSHPTPPQEARQIILEWYRR
jgi:hypothetical protein